MTYTNEKPNKENIMKIALNNWSGESIEIKIINKDQFNMYGYLWTIGAHHAGAFILTCDDGIKQYIQCDQCDLNRCLTLCVQWIANNV